jgi:hypothetical protein
MVKGKRTSTWSGFTMNKAPVPTDGKGKPVQLVNGKKVTPHVGLAPTKS